jgi:hypothetical protein
MLIRSFVPALLMGLFATLRMSSAVTTEATSRPATAPFQEFDPACRLSGGDGRDQQCRERVSKS